MVGMKQYFMIFFSLLAAVAVVLTGVAIKNYRDMAPPPSNDDSDWSGPHLVIDWPGIALLVSGIAGVSLVVWIVLRKQKRKSN